MKRKRIITLSVIGTLLAAIIIGSAVFINYDMSKERAVVDLYFINGDGTGIAAEQYEIKYRSRDELVENTMLKLASVPSDVKRKRVIPKDAEINNIDLYDNGSIVIDFSKGFITDDPARNVLDTYAVVKTLCSTGVASTVMVTAEGEPVTDRDGNKLEFISASDINLQSEEYSSEMRNIVLYFADKSASSLIREDRTVKITDQQPLEQYIINELIKGSDENNSLLSDKTVLMSVDIEDNICYLNFKSSFIKENAGNSDHERLVIYSIVDSLTELESISRVQFYMDGKRVDHFGSFEIKNCISRDTSMIKDN